MTNRNNSRNVWITWHHQTRSRNLAKELDLQLHEYFYNNYRLLRYVFSFFWTIKVLITTRPKVIFIQLSFLLLIEVVVYKILFPKKISVIADCHTKALRRRANGLADKIFWPLKRWSFRHVDLSIVTNKGMLPDLNELSHNYLLIPDKIPEDRFVKKTVTDNYCVYASSFAVDEPMIEIVEAAKLLPANITIYWTGKKPDALDLGNLPPNLVLVGYLSYNDYFNLIGNASCIMALTTEEDCLQSSGYEALAVNVPLVMSDTQALRSYFGGAAEYVKHTPQEISEAIQLVINEKTRFIENIASIKNQRNLEFDNLTKRIKLMIEKEKFDITHN